MPGNLRAPGRGVPSLLRGLGRSGGGRGRRRQVALADDLDVGARRRAVLARLAVTAGSAAIAPVAAILLAALAGRVAVVLGLARVLAAVLGDPRAVPRAPLDAGLRHLAGEEPDRADRVVVARDDEVDPLGIAVRVDHRDDRDAEPVRLVDGDVLLLRVDHEDRGGQPGHLLDAAEVLLELLALALERGDLLLREALVGAVGLHLVDGLQPLDALLHGLEVRERAAEPAVRHEEHARPPRLLADRVLGLLLRADEEDRAALRGRVRDEAERAAREADRLLQVDDVDAVAGAEDVRLHLRVPALRLVPEVNPRLEELLHRDGGAAGAEGGGELALRLGGGGGGRGLGGLRRGGLRLLLLRLHVCSFPVVPPLARAGSAESPGNDFRSQEHRRRADAECEYLTPPPSRERPPREDLAGDGHLTHGGGD